MKLRYGRMMATALAAVGMLLSAGVAWAADWSPTNVSNLAL